MSAAMDLLAMMVVVQTLLGADIEGEAAPLAADLRALSRWLPILAAPMALRLERAGVPPFRSAGQAADRIDAAVRGTLWVRQSQRNDDLWLVTRSVDHRPCVEASEGPFCPLCSEDLVPAGDRTADDRRGAA